MDAAKDLPALLREAGYITAAHYAALAAPMPESAVQRSKGGATGKGYDTTGYGYQFIVDRLNEVLGPSHWRTLKASTGRQDGETKGGRPWWREDCELTLEVGIWRSGQWETLASKDGDGWHRAMDPGDAKKGAFTNAIKKVAGLYGVGAEAYRGGIDDDLQPEAEKAEREGDGGRHHRDAASDQKQIPEAMYKALLKMADGEKRILDEVKLTDWERDFLPDILAKFRQYGKNVFVSPAQDAALVKIWDKVNLHFKAVVDKQRTGTGDDQPGMQGAARAVGDD